jgi:hypothetical protein
MFPHGISSRRVRLTLSSVLLGVCLLGLLASSAVAITAPPRTTISLGDPDYTPWNATSSQILTPGELDCARRDIEVSFTTRKNQPLLANGKATQIVEQSERLSVGNPLETDVARYRSAVWSWFLSFVIVR